MTERRPLPVRDRATIEELPVLGAGSAVVARTSRGVGRRSRVAAALAATLVAGAVAVAVAKPWGEGPQRQAGPAISFGPPTSEPTPEPGRTFAGPDAGLPSLSPTPFSAELFPADYAREAISPGLATHAEVWGIGTGAWFTWSRVPWTWWTAVAPTRVGASDGSGTGAGGAGSGGSSSGVGTGGVLGPGGIGTIGIGGSAPLVGRPVDCATATKLPAGLFVAVTAPSGLAAGSPISIGSVDASGNLDWLDIDQVTTPADRGVAYLLRRLAGRWPDGPYRILLERDGEALSLDVCLFSLTPASAMARSLPVGDVPSALLRYAGIEPRIYGPAPLPSIRPGAGSAPGTDGSSDGTSGVTSGTLGQLWGGRVPYRTEVSSPLPSPRPSASTAP